MRTLLDMVQGILSSIEGDNVDSYSDTEESLQVAFAIRDTYEYLVTSDQFRETKNILDINASIDSSKPLLMTLDSEIDNIEWMKYDVRSVNDPEELYKTLEYVTVDELLTYLGNHKSGDNIENFTLSSSFNSIKVYYENDKAPSKFCMLNNTTILFDSIDKGVDNTIQNSKVMAYGSYHYNFVFSDTFDFPNLTHQTKLIIYNEAKRQCSIEGRQMDNPIALQRARSLKTGGRNNRERIGVYTYGKNDPYPHYGRKK